MRAVSATHTFNAMRPLDHREPGILGTVLTDDSIYAELICDGIHNAPETVKLWWRAKGAKRGILVTDAISAAGMPDGEYRLGGSAGEIAVQVLSGKAMAGGVLAGSILTLDRALANFVEFTGAPLEDALRLLTTNPAAMTGLGDLAGALAVGAGCGIAAGVGGAGGRLHRAVGRPANLVAVDANGTLVASIVNGEVAFPESATIHPKPRILSLPEFSTNRLGKRLI